MKKLLRARKKETIFLLYLFSFLDWKRDRVWIRWEGLEQLNCREREVFFSAYWEVEGHCQLCKPFRDGNHWCSYIWKYQNNLGRVGRDLGVGVEMVDLCSVGLAVSRAWCYFLGWQRRFRTFQKLSCFLPLWWRQDEIYYLLVFQVFNVLTFLNVEKNEGRRR